MTPDTFLLAAYLGAFLLLLSAGTLVLRAWLGPDTDLDGWDPRDDRPFATCGSRSCRVDHATVGQWKVRAPR